MWRNVLHGPCVTFRTTGHLLKVGMSQCAVSDFGFTWVRQQCSFAPISFWTYTTGAQRLHKNILRQAE